MADYSAALLKRLQKLGRIEVNADDADIALYHVGNNRLHREIYERALQRPGVVVLHDAVLHHLFLGTLSETEYIREFTFNYGDWSEEQARELWRERARSAADPRYFRYPLLKRIAETSRAVIVHNPGAAEMVRKHAPGAKVCEIPHLFDPPVQAPPYEIERARSSLGLPRKTMLCGVFGHLRESKRVLPILRAYAAARREADLALLIAGQFVSSDLCRAATPLLASPGIIRFGYTPEDQFWRLAAAVDICLNLRYPAAGETSGIGIGLMGIAKPVVFTAGPETLRFPAAACLRVDPGEPEEDMLTQYLIWLAKDRRDAHDIGLRAQAYVREQHAPDSVAARYWDVLTAAATVDQR